MGDVYRARRADGLFDRAVAMKVVREGANTEMVLARFAAERRILGSLEPVSHAWSQPVPKRMARLLGGLGWRSSW